MKKSESGLNKTIGEATRKIPPSMLMQGSSLIQSNQLTLKDYLRLSNIKKRSSSSSLTKKLTQAE